MLKIYKPVPFVLIALLIANAACFAQDTAAVTQQTGKSKGYKKSKDYGEKQFELRIDGLDAKIDAGVNKLVNNILVKVGDISSKVDFEVNNNTKSININVDPKIGIQLNGLLNNLSLDIDPDVHLDFNDGGNKWDNGYGNKVEKSKTFSKSYPINGNDRIKLSNKYGRITVNTWERPEIKVDVQIKAWAKDDGDTQKLLNSVQIITNKNNDVVSFRTEIGGNDSFGGMKVRKVEIDYLVFMPAKTDLNVENSFGSIILPDLSGRITVSSSNGSIVARDLTNPYNKIEGSYGGLRVNSLNGGKLAFSYGSVEIAQCNNLKAELSYGSFKMGKLNNSADINLSNVSDFKIGNIATSLQKLNINSSYSDVILVVTNGAKFGFDITTTYGNFNFSDAKVIINSKTPNNGGSSTQNYKGYFGKGNTDAEVNIRSSYGGIKFE
jgi:hypothetical protein